MAKVFRLQNNVPDIYINESRDFQMLCNLFDIMNNGIKFDIDSMPNILDSSVCSDAVLPLIQTKVGFFTKRDLTTRELRHVLSAFKRVVKDKGSQIGVREAIEVYLKLINSQNGYKITITNTENFKKTLQSGESPVEYSTCANVYLIEIQLETTLRNLSVLREMLRYILPTGYEVQFGFYSAKNLTTEIQLPTDKLNIIVVSTDDNDRVIGATDGQVEVLKGQALSTFGQVGTTHAIPSPTED